MKTLLFMFLFSLSGCSSLTSEDADWALTEGLDTPESVYYHSSQRQFYISNIVGAPDKKDGKGYISRINIEGKNYIPKWFEGLHAPKGIRVHNGTLWVTDIDRVVGIRISTRTLIHSIPVKGARFLNDIAISQDGDLYVSDTLGQKIYKIHHLVAEVFMRGDKLDSPNGLLIDRGNLLVASWGVRTNGWETKKLGKLYKINLKTKHLSNLSPRFGNLDGLEKDKHGHYIISDWMAGKIYRVTPKGEVILIIEGLQKGAADLGLYSEHRLMLIPLMLENKVQAYTLPPHL